MTGVRSLVVVVALLAGALALDESGPPAAVIDRDRTAAAEVAGDDVISSTWYCPVVKATDVGADGGSVVMANLGEEDRQAVVVVSSGDGRIKTRSMTVPALGRAEIDPTALIEAKTVSVRVDFDGGGVAVERTVDSDEGRSTSPCADRPSAVWHTAAGSTARDASLGIVIQNPFPDPAIIDVVAATDRGIAQPNSLVGFVVPARNTEVLVLDDLIRRRDQISVTVTTRSGRVVVDRTLLFDGSDSRRGFAVSTAAPGVADEWLFPDGQRGRGIDQQLVVYNPNEDEAEVDVELIVDGGDAEPFAVTIPPGDVVSIDPGEDDRLPRGAAHSMLVRSLNDVGVVVERVVLAGEGSERAGMSAMFGLRRTADTWLIPDGRATKVTDQWVVIVNPFSEAASVSVVALVGGQRIPVADLESVTVPAAGRRAIRIGDHIRRDGLTLLIQASGPVAVERDLYAVAANGMSAAPGVAAPG